MNAPDPSLEGLMARLQAGDDAAATRVFQQFAARLIALARSRLDARLRQKVDPEDIVQSVYRSFFKRQGLGEFAFDDWDGLWSILTLITLRKCANQARTFRTAGRDVQREAAPAGAADESSCEPPGLEPSPEQAAVLTETVERLLRDLDEREREMVTLALEGHDAAEIGNRVGRGVRTVQLLLKQVKQRLQRWQAADANE